MNQRVTIDFAGGSEKKARSIGTGEIKRVPCAYRTDLERLHWMREVVSHTGRTCEVKNRVHRSGNRDPVDHVVFDEAESRQSSKLGDVLASARKEVIDRDNFPATGAQAAAEVKSEEPSPTGDDRTGHQQPTPWYENPRRRMAAGSSMLRASTIARGDTIVPATLAKSSQRNSSHSVRRASKEAPATA